MMRSISALVIALCLVLLCEAGPIVQTTHGVIEGFSTATHKVFSGILFLLFFYFVSFVSIFF